MARFLFLTWGGAGNQTPAIGLAAALADRGHAITFAGYPEQRDRFESLGFGFRALRRAPQAWPSTPPEDWMPVLLDAVWACQHHLQDVPEIVATEEPDVLVVDCLMFAALAAAERLPVRAAVLVHSAPGALVPPGGGLEGLVMKRVNVLRTEAGLPTVTALWDTWRPFTTLCASIPELDPLLEEVPAEFEFVGPMFEPHRGRPWQPPWAADDPRPLVVASFSTGVAWDQVSRIRRTLDALADGRHRVLVTTGPAELDRNSIPPAAVLATYVPHGAVLPQASVTITHAGHGTVAASLAHGVPLVCLPNLAADQPALAEQVARLGAGIALDGDNATPTDIAHAVNTATADDTYTRNARQLASVIDTEMGRDRAASRLESLAGFG